MCGIVGAWVWREGAAGVSRARLIQQRDRMAARGPDGAGLWLSPDHRVGLGHRRLAIIDLSEAGAQPMTSADGRHVIVFNGEIYNHEALRRELEATGHAFRSRSDTEVLLVGWQTWGEGVLPRLRGMFAFAIWDTTERRLVLARDRFGFKPLYYRHESGHIEFASQVRALTEGGEVDPEQIDPVAQAGFLLFGSVPEGHTLFEGIRELPAGHVLSVGRDGRLSMRAWGTVSALVEAAEAEPFRGSRADAVDACAAAIADSVTAHRIADVPIALFLSAGLDSSMIAAACRGGAPTRAVTLGFDEFRGTAEDEIPLATAVADRLGFEHVRRQVGRADFAEARDQLFADMDQPTIDGINSWFVSRAARQLGVKVALSGLGGDEIFAGYPSFRQVPRLRTLMRPFRGLPWLGRQLRRVALGLGTGRVASPKYAGLAEYGATLGGAYLLRRALFMPWEITQLLGHERAHRGLIGLGLPDTLERAIASIRSPENAVAALELTRYMRCQLLRDTDWASMAHGLEVRVPFIDTEVVRTVLAARSAYPEIGKRDVLARLAPEVDAIVGARRKTGFAVPVWSWLAAQGGPPSSGGHTWDRGLRGWARTVLKVAASPDPATLSGLTFGKAKPALPRRRPRVLIASIGPSGGGVQSMRQFAIDVLRAHGLEPVLAHYEPWSLTPRLSVPSYHLLQRTPGHEVRLAHGDVETHAIGAWLPELEFTHYWPTAHWRRVIESCEAWLVVSGNVLAADAIHRLGRPWLGWVATDWAGDRRDRVARFPWARRQLDRWVNAPVLRRRERALLTAGSILPLSEYTRAALANLAPAIASQPTLPVPVDAEELTPVPEARVAGRIGFLGRYDDPRKNIELLISAMAVLLSRGRSVELVLIGGRADEAIQARIAACGISGVTRLHERIPRADMKKTLQSLDVFVLPSHQEGLCIAALEAMACGVPVVSTRCGGPEEFVIPGETGELVGFDASEMADAIDRVLANRSRRDRMGAAARHLVTTRFSRVQAEAVFLDSVAAVFPYIARR